jgi:Leucine-rich repeat (LRR) protein
VDENSQDLQLARPGGETTVSVYANKYLTEFSNFKEFNWTGLATVDLPMLRNLDLSGLQGFTADNLFSGGVYTADGVGLKNIETLNLSGLKLASGTAAYTLDVSRCSKLKSINISNSDLTNVKYPDTLKTLDLSNTGIISLELSD